MPTTPDHPSSGEPLQFDAVEPAHPGSPAAGGTPVCAQCRKEIESQYYEIRGHIVCARCKELLAAKLVGRSGGLARAALFGLGGAVAGAALYYAVRVATGLEIGLIAIAVGWIVGRAVQRGAQGGGGRRYQLLAVGLTYVAIASTYVPLLIQEVHRRASDEQTHAAGVPASPRAASDSGAGDQLSSPDNAPGSGVAREKPMTGLRSAGALAALAGFVIALPIIANVLDMPSGLLGLAIIFIGLNQAWRMNKRVDLVFNGPYQVGGAAPRGAGSA